MPRRTRIIHSKVVGVTQRNRDGTDRQRIIADGCQVGEELTLLPEPDNPVDRYAIRLCRENGDQIGYMTRELAYEFMTEIDDDLKIGVWITELTGGTPDKPSRGVNIEIHLIPMTDEERQAASAST